MEIRSTHHYRFPASRRAVWAMLESVGAYRTWWPWLRRFDARGLAAGEVWRCTIRPPLPYTIRCRIELLVVEPPALVVARLTGDVAGQARLELRDRAPAAHDRRTGDPPAGHEQPANPAPAAHDRRTGDPPAGHEQPANPAPATHQEWTDVPPGGHEQPAGQRPGRGETVPATEAVLTTQLAARSLPARFVSRVAPGAAVWGHNRVFTMAARQFRAATADRLAATPGPRDSSRRPPTRRLDP